MRIIFIFNTLVLSVLVLFSNLAATRPCRTSSLVHNSELEDRGMAYPSPPPPSSLPPPKVPDGAICFFALNHETTQKLNLKSNENFILKNSKMKAQIDYKFKCGSSPKCVLKANHLFKKTDMIYFENMIQDRNSPHPVSFCRNEMTIEPQLFNNEELNIEGYCYAPTGIQNSKQSYSICSIERALMSTVALIFYLVVNGTELSWNIPWQNWGFRILPVQGIASYYASEAGMDLHNGMY
ncbi:hypothetical protein DFJ43DRAFT_1105108 [Lentinula guzmanii]|uniref:Autophagy-related protein 27 n=1 Tax=Lentinula guzmanii TaxID=2804957 RepID=A0AA38J3G0_9AGAR|nr:hypothetical protein DFJ43DRAFT_1105108 [Lentinula guzmanii]